MIMSHMRTMQIVGLVSGEPSPFDGEFIVEYDPGRDGVSPDGRAMACHLVTTPDREKALQLSQVDAFELWRKVDPRQPWRADGGKNRPLTAFTVTIKPA